MRVIIGVDPHKATHTAVAISGREEELDRKKVRAGGAQVEQLVSWATPFQPRTPKPRAIASGLLLQQPRDTVPAKDSVPAAAGSGQRCLGPR